MPLAPRMVSPPEVRTGVKALRAPSSSLRLKRCEAERAAGPSKRPDRRLLTTRLEAPCARPPGEGGGGGGWSPPRPFIIIGLAKPPPPEPSEAKVCPKARRLDAPRGPGAPLTSSKPARSGRRFTQPSAPSSDLPSGMAAPLLLSQAPSSSSPKPLMPSAPPLPAPTPATGLLLLSSLDLAAAARLRRRYNKKAAAASAASAINAPATAPPALPPASSAGGDTRVALPAASAAALGATASTPVALRKRLRREAAAMMSVAFRPPGSPGPRAGSSTVKVSKKPRPRLITASQEAVSVSATDISIEEEGVREGVGVKLGEREEDGVGGPPCSPRGASPASPPAARARRAAAPPAGDDTATATDAATLAVGVVSSPIPPLPPEVMLIAIPEMSGSAPVASQVATLTGWSRP